MKPLMEGLDLPQRSLEVAKPALTLCLADVQPLELKWLWKHRVSVGCLTVLAGSGGVGKSLVTLDMASRVTTGTPFFDTPEVPNPKGAVVLIAAEDPIETVVVPRLLAAGADRSRVRTLPSEVLGRLSLVDIETLEGLVAETPDTRLLIIDTPSALAVGGASPHRGLTTPLAEFARKHDLAVVLVTQGTEKTVGSVSWRNAVRTIWWIAKDPRDWTRYRLLPIKNNLAPETVGLVYRIAEDAPRIEWEILDDPANASRAPRYGAPRDGMPGPAPDKSVRAAAWLWTYLQDGPVPIQKIVFAARQAGILLGDSLSPLYNAKNRIPELHNGCAIQQFEAPYGEFGRMFLHWRIASTTTHPTTTAADQSVPPTT